MTPLDMSQDYGQRKACTISRARIILNEQDFALPHISVSSREYALTGQEKILAEVNTQRNMY